MVIVHFFEGSRIVREVIFKSESSLGSIFRLRVPRLEAMTTGADHAVDRFEAVGRRDRSADGHCAKFNTGKSNRVMMSGHLARQVLEIVGYLSFQV